MNTAKVDSTQDRRERKPALILIEVLVAVIIVGVLAAVFVPKIIRRQREAPQIHRRTKRLTTTGGVRMGFGLRPNVGPMCLTAQNRRDTLAALWVISGKMACLPCVRPLDRLPVAWVKRMATERNSAD